MDKSNKCKRCLLRAGFEGTWFSACQLSSFASKNLEAILREMLCVSKFSGYFTPVMLKNSEKKLTNDAMTLSQNKERIN